MDNETLSRTEPQTETQVERMARFRRTRRADGDAFVQVRVSRAAADALDYLCVTNGWQKRIAVERTIIAAARARLDVLERALVARGQPIDQRPHWYVGAAATEPAPDSF